MKKRNAYLASKVYLAYYGFLPVDEAGRKFEIHHIDGNHENNEISNLKAVSIKEHYDIHFAQKDWQACFAISKRLGIDPQTRSDLSRAGNLKRVSEGRHPFQTRSDGTSLTQDRVKNGTNPFLRRSDGSSVTKDKVERGTHNFLKRLDGSSLASDRVKKGSHHFCGNDNPSKKRVSLGIHHLQGDNHHNFDSTLYVFKLNEIIEFCTRHELIKKYNLPGWLVSRIIKNPGKKFREWCLSASPINTGYG